MNISEKSYKALKAFERAPGSIKRYGEQKELTPAQQDGWVHLVRSELTSARELCGAAQHSMKEHPSSETLYSSPSLRQTCTTTGNTETWTHPEKNAFVKVRHESTFIQSEGYSSSGALCYDSSGRTDRRNASYGIETDGYVAGMRVADNGYSQAAVAFKIDKHHPEQSWIQEWNIR
ncbi:hypothetical protein JST97_06005 [bacterium]|nr:hypothetical protein [bacterium]